MTCYNYRLRAYCIALIEGLWITVCYKGITDLISKGEKTPSSFFFY